MTLSFLTSRSCEEWRFYTQLFRTQANSILQQVLGGGFRVARPSFEPGPPFQVETYSNPTFRQL